MKRAYVLRWAAVLTAALTLTLGEPASAQKAASTGTSALVVGHAATLSDQSVSLTFDLGSGERLRIAVEGGTLSINGASVAAAPAGGVLDRALRELVSQAGASTTEAVTALQELQEVDGSTGEQPAREALHSAVARLHVADAVLPDLAEIPAVVVGLPARARPAPRIEIPDVGPDVHIVVSGRTSLVGGIVGAAVNLAAVFLAMSFMGLGLLIFAPRQIEVIADTVWHSFGRSFLAGLFAQPLLIPAFATMIVGLTLTIVGILVIPFAVVAFLTAFILAAVGGVVAVARTIGEIYLRRKMAQGHAIATWGSYRYILYGLGGLSAIWVPAVLLGPVPVAGPLLTASAAFVTWALATAGFGATIISRAGMRGTFVRKLDLALTDEQYWTDEDMPTPYRSTPPRHR